METAVQRVATAALSKRQLNSVRALQRKVDATPSATMRVSAAQYAAMQTAWTAAKASGLPIDAAAYKAAAELGLK